MTPRPPNGTEPRIGKRQHHRRRRCRGSISEHVAQVGDGGDDDRSLVDEKWRGLAWREGGRVVVADLTAALGNRGGGAREE